MIVIQALLGAIAVGALFSGGCSAISGMQEHGAINQAVVESAAQAAVNGAAEGALVGGVFGGVLSVAGPAIKGVNSAAKPVLGAVDDLAGPAINSIRNSVNSTAKPVVSAIDDLAGPAINSVKNTANSAAKSVGGAIDDLAGPAINSIKNTVNSATKSVGGAIDDLAGPAINSVRNTVNSAAKSVGGAAASARNALFARFYQSLPKTTAPSGYVYVMEDVANSAQKIGLTTNPAARLAQVERTVGSKLKYACIIPTSNMRALESLLHTTYASQNLPNTGAGREWFKLSAAQLTAACSK